MLLQPGSAIDEFQIVDILGNGGFSVVYKAEDTELERTVAIKQFTYDAFQEQGAQERFIREAKLAASLNHPHIVSTYTLKRRADALYLIMEYLDGGTVRDLINEYGVLSLGTVQKLIAHVCPALEFLHQRGIIHRDIKPENILCTATGDYKLADFGLAHIMQGEVRRGSAGPQSGTLLYMSPEQASGEELTIQSDIYSFAAVLYECLTGYYYLSIDDNEDQMIDDIVTLEPIPPSQVNPDLPPELDAPILRAMQKVPELRHASASAFLDELRTAFRKARKRSLPAQVLADAQAALYEIRTLRDLLNEPAQALARLDQPWLRDLHLPEVIAERGATLLALEDSSGYELLRQAVEAKPALPFAQMALAEYFRSNGQHDRYKQAMIQAINADADLVYAMYYTVIVESMHDADAYWEYVGLFIAAEPTASVLFNVGRVLALAQGYEEEAIAAFQRALALDSLLGPAYVALGSLLMADNRLNEAIYYYEHALQVQFIDYPKGEWHKSPSAYQRTHALLGLALAHGTLGDVAQCAAYSLQLMRNNPSLMQENENVLVGLLIYHFDANPTLVNSVDLDTQLAIRELAARCNRPDLDMRFDGKRRVFN